MDKESIIVDYKLYGFLLEYTYKDFQFFSELEVSNHSKALLFYLNGNCRSIDLTGRESLFVKDLIDCGINSLERVYWSFEVETIYRPSWNIEISYDDKQITSYGSFDLPDNYDKFRHCMNRWMYNNGGITVYTWDSIQNSLTV